MSVGGREKKVNYFGFKIFENIIEIIKNHDVTDVDLQEVVEV